MKSKLCFVITFIFGIAHAEVHFSGDFLQDRAVKFVTGDVAKMLSGMDGRIVLKRDMALKER